jgi:ribose transport system permease protein
MLKKIRKSKSFTLAIIVVLIIIFFTILNKNYMSGDNIRNIMNAASVSGIVAVGMGCLLISGEADLSAGSVAAMGGVLCAYMLQAGLAWPLAVLITLCFGAFAGLFNAFLCYKLHFFSFIATLAMQSVWTGLVLVITKSNNVAISNEGFWKIGSTRVFGFFPLPFVIMLLLFVIYGIILSNTRFGRKLYMVGGNRAAARLAGINADKIHTIMLINCSTLASLAGIVLAARMHNGSPTACSSSSLDAITASCLGGIAFTGGSGGMVGGVIGLLMLACFNNGLTVAGLDAYWQVVASGLLLIAALTLDFINERSRIRALKAGAADSKKA